MAVKCPGVLEEKAFGKIFKKRSVAAQDVKLCKGQEELEAQDKAGNDEEFKKKPAV